MKRNCNLELRLVTSSDYNGPYNSMLDSERRSDKKPLTIFYNGEVGSWDATEIEARTIIFLPSKEMEEKSRTGPGFSPCPSPGPSSPICSPKMKRSLQRFLEKRKARAQSVSPHSITKH